LPRFLVTGGAGFIGSHLVAALVGRGDEVRVFDNFSTGRDENLGPVQDRIALWRGDIRDRRALQEVMVDIDYVIHEAALVSATRSVNCPEETHEVNVTGALNVLIEASSARVRRVVLASSSAVYGDGPVPAREDSLARPLTPYAASKLAAEAYAQAFSSTNKGLEVVCLRCFNVYGPRQDPSSEYSGVIARFALALSAQEHGIIYGDGSQSRDFVYVDDVVRANLLACEVPGVRGRVFNIGTGQAIRIVDLYRRMGAICGISKPPRFEPPRAGDILHSRSSPALAKRLLGFQVKVGLEEGLGRTLAWYGVRSSRSFR
jgi:UDP-glucose 4-epimerase